mmetsp:Transcript_76866/g.172475  ORF Transcript_76866/g.172475 Transcript_76866/m.172475 type:complete len:249 (-) Transcript_76866:74-820(-)
MPMPISCASGKSGMRPPGRRGSDAPRPRAPLTSASGGARRMSARLWPGARPWHRRSRPGVRSASPTQSGITRPGACIAMRQWPCGRQTSRPESRSCCERPGRGVSASWRIATGRISTCTWGSRPSARRRPRASLRPNAPWRARALSRSTPVRRRSRRSLRRRMIVTRAQVSTVCASALWLGSWIMPPRAFPCKAGAKDRNMFRAWRSSRRGCARATSVSSRWHRFRMPSTDAALWSEARFAYERAGYG